MKNLSKIILLLILFSSCNKVENTIEGGYALHFLNRDINNIMAGYGDFSNLNPDLSNIPPSDLRMFVMTFPLDYSREFSLTPNIRPEYVKNVADPDITIEKNITNYYKKNTQTSTSTKSTDALNLIPIEYRTEELKEFNITSTSAVFGKNAGESLNSLFDITYIGPKDILISAIDKKVIENKSRENKPVSINELVTNKILAPSIIILRCNSSEKLSSPVTTSFIIQMKIGEKNLTFETVPVTLK